MRSKSNLVYQPERTAHYDCAMCVGQIKQRQLSFSPVCIYNILMIFGT